jgi:O-antigen ligase
MKRVNLESWAYQPAHNIYLLIAAELGWPALLAFLVFLFSTIKTSWSGLKNDALKSYWLFVIGYLLIIGLFDHFLWDLQQGQILFWLTLGILASLSPEYDKKI